MLGGLVDLNVAIGDDLKGIFTPSARCSSATGRQPFRCRFDRADQLNLRSRRRFITFSGAYNGSEIACSRPTTTDGADGRHPRAAANGHRRGAVARYLPGDPRRGPARRRRAQQTDLALFRAQRHWPLPARAGDRRRREDQIYFFDEKAGAIVAAPRGTLRLTAACPRGQLSRDARRRARVEVKPVLDCCGRSRPRVHARAGCRGLRRRCRGDSLARSQDRPQANLLLHRLHLRQAVSRRPARAEPAAGDGAQR